MRKNSPQRHRGHRGDLLKGIFSVISVSLWYILLLGCGRASAAPAPDIRIIGGPGSGDGLFATPRAAAWDPKGSLYVVDKTGRIQKFDVNGAFVRGWRMPEVEKGRPTGLAIDPQGRLVVADTHYHRIVRYSPDGELLGTFGSEGTDPGQFIYPVGLAIAGDGTIYVSEYGADNDRIQVFTAEGKLLRSWGTYGDEAGQFKRPQSIALAGDRLFVADAANHRVQVFSLDGKPLGAWGDLRYPYGVSIDGEGNVLVAEYGRHRISKFRPDGAPCGTAGRPGSAPGELNVPWSAVAAGDRVFVVDSGNHRVQVWPSSLLK